MADPLDDNKLAKRRSLSQPDSLPPLAESLPEPEPVRPSRQAPLPRGQQRPRASLEQEKLAEQFLRQANLLRMRGELKQSLEELVKAIEANPYDPAPHTMSAEILRNVGRPDDAIIAYEQAINLTLPGAGRAAVEAKLARLVMEQDELNNAPIVVAGAGGNAPIDRSAMTTVGASAVVPGLGQFMAGEPVKGVVFFVIWASATVLFARIGMPKAGGIPPSLALACAIATGAWVASMVDAYLMVKRGQ